MPKGQPFASHGFKTIYTFSNETNVFIQKLLPSWFCVAIVNYKPST